jgi:hypothetical protein
VTLTECRPIEGDYILAKYQVLQGQ